MVRVSVGQGLRAPQTRVLLSCLVAAVLAACVVPVDLGVSDGLVVGPETPPPRSKPCLSLGPTMVDFGNVASGSVVTQDVVLVNRCLTDRLWLSVKMGGDDGFELLWAGERITPSPELASTGHTWKAPFTVPASGHIKLTIQYRPLGRQPAGAHVVFETDDPVVGGGLPLRLVANSGPGCIALAPKIVDFGPRVAGEVSRKVLRIVGCDAGGSTIVDLALTGSTAFSLGMSSLPVVLADGEALEVDIEFAAGEAIGTRDEATLIVSTQAQPSAAVVPVVGIAVDGVCEVAELLLSQPQAVVGEPVVASAVTLTGERTWYVTGPGGYSPPLLVEGEEARFVPLVAGTYGIRLDIELADGSCQSITRFVVADAPASVRVELLWRTPNDPDPHDTGPDRGSDLDLHLQHPFAIGVDIDSDGSKDGWFDVPFDVFFGNRNATWPSGQTLYWRDDHDGTGPEVIEVQADGDVSELTVGVHSWHDHGFGPSDARVRVLLGGVTVWETPWVRLHPDDFWVVGTIDVVTGAFLTAVDSDGGWHIVAGVRPEGIAVEKQ